MHDLCTLVCIVLTLVDFWQNLDFRMKAKQSGAKPSSRVQSPVVGRKVDSRLNNAVVGCKAQ